MMAASAQDEDPAQRLQRLAARATAGRAAPVVDVRAGVLAAIRENPTAGTVHESGLRTDVMAALAAVGSSAALALGVVAYQICLGALDPLGPFLSPWGVVLP
jgi:hypothetical protein